MGQGKGAFKINPSEDLQGFKNLGGFAQSGATF